NAHFLIIDVAGSVGEILAGHHNLSFFALTTGKLRRYFSLRTAPAPFLVVAGFFQALYLLRQRRITLVVGAGGFAQVPVVWAALCLRLPTHIHQQDVL